MKIGLISGHGAGDPGANGCGYNEADLTVEVVKMLVPRFNAIGIDTKVYPYENNAYKDAKNGGIVVDFSDCTYVLEVHFNACVNDQDGDGRVTGSEIWVTPREEGVSVEVAILSELEALGFTNRGVKKEDFLVINKVKNQGVSSALIETCFIDDADDMELFNNDRGAVADAIVKGIADGFGYEHSIQPASEPADEVEYSVGDFVTYDTVFTSSTSDNPKTPTEGFTSGTITRIIPGARNPYLINDGQGWINAGCITSSSVASQPSEPDEPIKVGDKVKILVNATYDGGSSVMYYDTYDVIRINGDRVVIGIGDTVTCAINIKNIAKI